MQSQSPHALISTVSAGVHLVLLIVMFVVVLIGWRRQRNLGFLVLMAWTGMNGLWWCSMPFMGMIYPRIASALSVSQPVVVIASHAISGTILSIILLFGIALLVFQKRQNTPQA